MFSENIKTTLDTDVTVYSSGRKTTPVEFLRASCTPIGAIVAGLDPAISQSVFDALTHKPTKHSATCAF